MIRRKNIYNLIKVCEIYYEPVDVVRAVLTTEQHLSTRIYSYEPLAVAKDLDLVSSKKTTRIILENKSDDEIFASFRKNYRNEVRKTYTDSRYSFVIKEGLSLDGYELYKEFEIESGRPFLKPTDMSGVWALGYIDGVLVSGIHLINCSPVLKVVAIFSIRKKTIEDDITMGMIGFMGKRLMYEVCLFAQKRDFFCVDLAYINTESDERIGITNFKLGFGGDIVTEYVYENNSRIKRLLKRLRKKIRI